MRKLEENIDYIAELAHLEGNYITALDPYTEQIKQRMRSGPEQFGDELPWHKTHDKFRMRPGEVTLWAGINGHGKSMLLSHVMAHLMKTSTCLIASLEMKIDALGARLLRQMLQSDNAVDRMIHQAIDWCQDRLWVYDQIDTVQTDRILGMIIHAFKDMGVNHVFVDSMMKCGIDDDDYNRQKDFLNTLSQIAKAYNGHIHLVVHSRKLKSEEEIPDKFDIMGSSSLSNLTDNIAIVWRNKPKESKDDPEELEPDCVLKIAKQRHGEWEGKFALYFDKLSQQYKSGPTSSLEWFKLETDNVVERVQANG